MTPRETPGEGVGSELQILARGAGWASLWNVVGQAAALLATLVITRVVGATVFGSVAVGLSVLTMIQVAATLGMDRGVLRFVSYYLGQGRPRAITQVVGYAAGLSVAVTLAFTGVYVLGLRFAIARLLPQMEGAEFVLTVIILAAPVLALLPIGIHALIGIQRPAMAQVGTSVVRPIMQLVLLLFLVQWMSSLRALTYATVGAYLLATAFVAFALVHSIRRLPEPLPQSSGMNVGVTFAEFMRFSVPLALIPALNLAGQQLDILIVGHFMGGAETGIYAIVRRLSTLAMLPLLIAGGVTAATISKLFARDDLVSIRRIYVFATKWVYLASAAIVVVLLVEAEDLLALFGSSFPMGASALRIVAVGQLLNAAVGPSGSSLLMVGHHRLLLLNSMVSAVTGLTLVLTLVPRLGLVGAGLAVACTLALVNALSAFQLALKLRVIPGARLHWIKRIVMLGVSLGAAGAVAAVVPWVLARIALVALVSVSLVMGMGLFWEGLSADDRSVVRASGWHRSSQDRPHER